MPVISMYKQRNKFETCLLLCETQSQPKQTLIETFVLVMIPYVKHITVITSYFISHRNPRLSCRRMTLVTLQQLLRPSLEKNARLASTLSKACFMVHFPYHAWPATSAIHCTAFASMHSAFPQQPYATILC